MGLLKKLRRHAAVARGDFGMLFKDVKIPSLPAAVNRLIAEINRSEPDINRLVKLISSDPEITARVIKTVNSSLYSPRVPQQTLFFRVVAFFSRLQLWYLIRKIDNPHYRRTSLSPVAGRSQDCPQFRCHGRDSGKRNHILAAAGNQNASATRILI